MNLINTTYTANLSTILAEDVGTPELRNPKLWGMIKNPELRNPKLWGMIKNRKRIFVRFFNGPTSKK